MKRLTIVLLVALAIGLVFYFESCYPCCRLPLI